MNLNIGVPMNHNILYSCPQGFYILSFILIPHIKANQLTQHVANEPPGPRENAVLKHKIQITQTHILVYIYIPRRLLASPFVLVLLMCDTI